MELKFLDSQFKWLGTVDVFGSFIWTDRFNRCGDFEFVTFPSSSVLSLAAASKYVSLEESEHLMSIEIVSISTDVEDGNTLTLKGRSIEAILDRRIIWFQRYLTGNFQTKIQDLIDTNIISPTDTNRQITNFNFVASTDPNITTLTIDTQMYGESLYAAISTLCINKDIGYKITVDANGDFNFALYAGVDRSYGQTANPSIVFSPEFDNLLNSDYVETDQYLKSVALVAGEKGVGNRRETVTSYAPSGGGTGLNRREMFVDASSLSRNTQEGQIPLSEYLTQLEGKGEEELSKNVFVSAFDGEAFPNELVYGVDFSIGDIVQIENEYGYSVRSRIVEYIFSQDPSGAKIYPTFEAIIE